MEHEKLNIPQNLPLQQAAVNGRPYNYSENDLRTNTKAPIKKGCPNKECFCTGRCNEIIGWRDKLPNEL